MALYIQTVQALLYLFEAETVEQVLQSKNVNVNALAHLAFAYETNLPRIVVVEIMEESSLVEVELMDIDQPEVED